jgi:protein SDA1
MVAGLTVASGGRGAERIGDLLALQGRCKRDPEGYENELLLQLRHFDACLSIFLLQPTTAGTNNSAASDPGAAKEMADMAMFLAHMTPVYPQHLGKFPVQLLELLKSHGATIQPFLRRQLTQALVLLRNRKVNLGLHVQLSCGCSLFYNFIFFGRELTAGFNRLLADD